MKPKFIHLEGTDLSGKTSVAKRLLRKTPFLYQHNSISTHSPEGLGSELDKMDELGLYSHMTLSLGYAACVLADIDRFEWPRKDTVQDSSSSVRCLSRLAIDGQDALFDIVRSRVELDHPRFTRSYYLTTTIDERVKRANNMISLTRNDLMILHDTKRFAAMDKVALSISRELFNSTVIDTTNASPDEIANIIEQDLNE